MLALVEDKARKEIKSQDDLKMELKEQFFSYNTTYFAQETLKKLRQNRGLVRKYVKKFSTLMLNIKIVWWGQTLYFSWWLDNWPRAELPRTKPKDSASTISFADSLVDFRQDEAPTDSNKEKGRQKRVRFSRSLRRPCEEKVWRWRTRKTEEGVLSKANAGKSFSACFICQGSHGARDCPKKDKLNALVTGVNE